MCFRPACKWFKNSNSLKQVYKAVNTGLAAQITATKGVTKVRVEMSCCSTSKEKKEEEWERQNEVKVVV